VDRANRLRAGEQAVTADVIQLSSHRAKRLRSTMRAVGIADYTLGAWLSKEHQAVMSPYPPSLPCERVPADLIELPADCERTD
jgi:hypothetical protein